MAIEIKYIDTNLIEACSSISKILELPVLKIEKRYRDYLDYVKPTDLTHSVMRGTDIFNRMFITIGLSCRISDIKIDLVIVLFQRYTNENKWVSVSNPHGHKSLLWNPDESILYDRIRQLLTNGKISIYNLYHEQMIDYVLA